MADLKDIQDLAKTLNLMNVASGVIDLTNEQISNKEYLYRIFSEEVRLKSENKLKQLHKDAKLPNKKFNHDKITKGLEWQLDKIKQFDFKTNK